MFAFAVQFGQGDHPTRGSLLAPLLAIVISAVVGAGLIAILGRLIPAIRHALHARRAAQRQLEAAANTELRARMQMDELCPNGWQAHIMVFSSAAELPADAPEPERVRVALDWAPIGVEASPDTVVVRRVWSETIGQALEAMVADRVTDDTLAQIELQALADGAEWPDP